MKFDLEMSTRPKGYGLSRELADKVAAKYSQEDELEIVAWLCDMTRAEPPEEAGPDAFKVWLKDGTILCALMDVLQPGICKKPHDVSKIRLQALRMNKEYENISFFLEAAVKYGVPRHNLFQTVDLADGSNLSQVQTGLYNVGSTAQKKGFEGPVIGAKMSNKNVRKFDEETMKAGQNIIGLQMGTNQGSSQKGMTPYGLGRQMTMKNSD
jgi:hypothetical protein